MILQHLSCLVLILLFIFIDVYAQADAQQVSTSTSIVSHCVGGTFTCYVFADGQMKCLGKSDSFGENEDIIGDSINELGDSLPYLNLGSNVSIKKVSCGALFLCVLLGNKSIKCLGSNNNGQAGIGSSAQWVGKPSGHYGDSLPIVNLGTSIKALDVTTGHEHVCVKVTGNKIKCFGRNDTGQLGLGNTADLGSSLSQLGDNLPFVNLGTNVEVSIVSSNSYATYNCAILSAPAAAAQRIKCWGYSGYWNLGYGDITNRGEKANQMGENLPLIDLGDESRVKQLALGMYHTCTLLVSDAVKCFGNNGSGQIAAGAVGYLSNIGNSLPFVTLDTFKVVKALSAGSYNTCLIYTDDVTVKCIGLNGEGQLGQGDTKSRGNTQDSKFPNIPVIQLGTGSLKISSIASGYKSNCIVFVDSSVKCFGYNAFGQLGIGSTTTAIGDGSNEMGNNLKFTLLFSPTKSPTNSPTAPCSYSTSITCNSDPSCLWMKAGKKKKCGVLYCSMFNQKKCMKAVNKCTWNTTISKCVPAV